MVRYYYRKIDESLKSYCSPYLGDMDSKETTFKRDGKTFIVDENGKLSIQFERPVEYIEFKINI